MSLPRDRGLAAPAPRGPTGGWVIPTTSGRHVPVLPFISTPPITVASASSASFPFLPPTLPALLVVVDTVPASSGNCCVALSSTSGRSSSATWGRPRMDVPSRRAARSPRLRALVPTTSPPHRRPLEDAARSKLAPPSPPRFAATSGRRGRRSSLHRGGGGIVAEELGRVLADASFSATPRAELRRARALPAYAPNHRLPASDLGACRRGRRIVPMARSPSTCGRDPALVLAPADVLGPRHHQARRPTPRG